MSGLWLFRHGKSEIFLCYVRFNPLLRGGCYGDLNTERLGGFHA